MDLIPKIAFVVFHLVSFVSLEESTELVLESDFAVMFFLRDDILSNFLPKHSGRSYPCRTGAVERRTISLGANIFR
jgi:hypothetical protein